MPEGEAWLHANHITFDRNTPRASNAPKSSKKLHTAIAAQSPRSFKLCERFLVQGLESRLGLFQFVSRRGHAVSCGLTKEVSREEPILDQLLSQRQICHQEDSELLIGGRYLVTQIKPVSEDTDHRHAMLTVIDRNDNDNKIEMPLTQAGLKFTGRVLGAAQIERANALMEAHKKSLPLNGTDASQPAEDPLIASFAGIGRNAALITYREVRARLDALPATITCGKHWLDDTLVDVINTGRRDRGNRFIHSDAQLQELKEILAIHVARHDRSGPTAQRSPQYPKGFSSQPLAQPSAPTLAPPLGPRDASERARVSIELAKSLPAQTPVVSDAVKPLEETVVEPAQLQTSARAGGSKSVPNSTLAPPNPPSKKRKPLADLRDACRNKANEWLGRIQVNETEQEAIQREVVKTRRKDFLAMGLHPDKAGHLPDYGYPLYLSGQLAGIFFPQSPSTYRDFVTPLYTKLNGTNGLDGDTHVFQEVAAAGLNCWMRATWLSVLKSTSPEDLAVRLEASARKPLSSVVKDDIAFLTKLSREYNAVNFTDHYVRDAATEQRLRALQIKIIASYTHSDNKRTTDLIGELERLKNPSRTAVSDLPVVLHRALGLPVMVVEVDRANCYCLIRVAGPDDSELGREIAKWNERQLDDQIQERTNFLLNQFRKIPVIWLSPGHYDVFMPKVQDPA